MLTKWQGWMIKLINLSIALLLCCCSSVCMAQNAQNSDQKQTVVDQKYVKGKFKLGDPYRVKGKEYTPSVDHTYTEEGIASWYGNEFKGKRTANGSVFTGKEHTAAHRTLPLPSVVKVTNLSNGKSLEVVINDRGPFNNRIIDVSHTAAKELGFAQKGKAKVRVEYLHDKTLALLAMFPADEQQKALETFRTAQLNKSQQINSILQ